MALLLKCFRNTSPNKGNSLHYFMGRFALSDYFNELVNNGGQSVATLTLDNYRINGLQLKIAYPDAGALLNYSLISYVVEYDDANNSVYRAFHVLSFSIQSGYILFDLEIDKWLECIRAGATISRAHVTRCNLNLPSIGWFDSIGRATFDLSKYYQRMQGNSDFDNDDFYKVVFVVDQVTERNILGTFVYNETKIYEIGLNELRLAMPQDPANLSSVELAAKIISAIYAIDSGASDFACQVKGMYIVPSSILGVRESGAYGQRFKSTGYADGQLTFTAYFCRPNKVQWLIGIDPATLNLNYKYFAGIFGEGMELIKYTKPFNVIFDYSIGFNKVSVVVRQGSDEYDATNAFELPIVGSGEALDGLQTMAYFLKVFGDQFKIVTSSYKQGGAAGIASAATKELDIVQQALSTRVNVSTINGRGDAWTTFNWNVDPSTNYVRNPYIFSCYKSVNDEYENVRYNGANFDCYVSGSFNLGFGFEDNDRLSGDDNDVAFIKIDDCELSGLPESVRAFAKAEFARGIYYSVL